MKFQKNKLIAYSTVATVFISFSPEADAQVIYTDIDPDILLDEPGDKAGVDLDQDGVNDIVFQKNLLDLSFPYYYGSNTYQIYYGLNFLRAKVAGDHSLLATYSSYGYVFPLALDAGDPIDAEQTWIASSQQFLERNIKFQVATESGFSYSGSYAYGYWQPGDNDKYLGVKLKIDKSIYYGWVRLSITDESGIVIKDHAINLISGADITAGQTEGPVSVQTLNDNTVNAYSYSNTLYVNLNITIHDNVPMNIYDMNGRLVFEQILANGNTSIHLPLPFGLYTLQLLANDGMYAKEFVLQ